MKTQSSKKYDLVVVGEVNPDLILTGDVTPEFGQVEKVVEGARLAIGSSSAIFACGAARLGLKVVFIGKTGEDVFGRFMAEAMAQRGVDMRGIQVDRTVQTGLSVILSKGNDRAILTYLGAIAAMQFAEIDLDLVAQARHLHLGSYFMQDGLRPDVPRLFRAARELGLTTSLDTNYDPSERWSQDLDQVLAYTDVFLPNETELLAITRAGSLEEGLERITRQVPVAAVKLGARGGVAVQGAARTRAPAVPVKVVDTTGAGDTFDAGFIYGFLHEWDLAQSLRLAIACGSLSTQAAGGTEGQPSLAQAMEAITVGRSPSETDEYDESGIR